MKANNTSGKFQEFGPFNSYAEADAAVEVVKASRNDIQMILKRDGRNYLGHATGKVYFLIVTK